MLSPPTTQSPFAFFHVRKAGGLTLRKIINAELDNQGGNITRWIPCNDPPDCVPYSMPPYERKAVYASHVNYMELVSALREDVIDHDDPSLYEQKTLANGKVVDVHLLGQESEKFDCITTLRPTVSRVVSCWNYRFVQQHGQGSFTMPPAEELRSQDWTNLLPNQYDGISNGCNNEIYRIFGGSSSDERYVNTITANHPAFLFEFNRTAQHLASCVVLMTGRCEESTKVLSHFMPWLGDGVDLCRVHENESLVERTKKQLQEGAEDAILEQNQMDELLFQLGTAIFEKQLQVVAKR
ncbi:hypothetical protein ACHAXT_009805 [Thalassiosira profunda]